MQSKEMQAKHKTMIVTGASQGIGAGVTKVFLERGYNVVANSRNLTKSAFTPGKNLALVDGNIGHASTAERLAEKAISNFGSIDGVVNNAGIFFTKPFTDFTADDFRRLSETNLEGYVYITQLAVKQMLAQKTGGRVTFITSAMVEPSHRGGKSFHTDDHKGRPRGDHAQSCDGVCQGRHPLQRRRSRSCRHAVVCKRFEGVNEKPVADWDGPGYHPEFE